MNFLSCSWVFLSSSMIFSYFYFWFWSSVSFYLFNLASISWYSFLILILSCSISSCNRLISALNFSSPIAPLFKASSIYLFNSSIFASRSEIVCSLSLTTPLVAASSSFLSMIVFDATSNWPVLSYNWRLRSSISACILCCISLVLPALFSLSFLSYSIKSSI